MKISSPISIPHCTFYHCSIMTMAFAFFCCSIGIASEEQSNITTVFDKPQEEALHSETPVRKSYELHKRPISLPPSNEDDKEEVPYKLPKELESVPYLKIYQIGETKLFLVGENHEANSVKTVSAYINGRAAELKSSLAYAQEATIVGDPKTHSAYTFHTDRLGTDFQGRVFALEGHTRILTIVVDILSYSQSLQKLEKEKPPHMSDKDYEETKKHFKEGLISSLWKLHRGVVYSDRFLELWAASIKGFYSQDQVSQIRDLRRSFWKNIKENNYPTALNLIEKEGPLPRYEMTPQKAYRLGQSLLRTMMARKMVAPNREKRLLNYEKTSEGEDGLQMTVKVRWRNLEMFGNLENILSDREQEPPKELYAIVGVGHVSGLDYELKKKHPRMKELYSYLDPKYDFTEAFSKFFHLGRADN